MAQSYAGSQFIFSRKNQEVEALSLFMYADRFHDIVHRPLFLKSPVWLFECLNKSIFVRLAFSIMACMCAPCTDVLEIEMANKILS